MVIVVVLLAEISLIQNISIDKFVSPFGGTFLSALNCSSWPFASVKSWTNLLNVVSIPSIVSCQSVNTNPSCQQFLHLIIYRHMTKPVYKKGRQYSLSPTPAEYAKFAGLAGHVWWSLINVRQRGLISPDILSSESKSRKMSSKWITSEKFYIRQTFYGQMSGNNSKCLVKDWKFAGQNVKRG